MILQFWYSHMSRPTPLLLKARKSPRQARSAATIEAIHVATIQVLLATGVGRLTTTRVAERAGVSVGTMYQYYPHKQALLFAVVERQIHQMEQAMRDAAARLMGSDIRTVAYGLANAWLDAKMADRVASRAIYGIAAEFDLSNLMKGAAACLTEVIDGLLAHAPDADFADRASATFMLAALLGGSVRIVLEIDASEDHLASLRRELPQACHAYLLAASGGHA